MPSQLQTLTIQFNALLDEYQETSKKYTDLVTNNDNTLSQIYDYAFIGEKKLVVLGEPNVSACQSDCYANKLCSGATFNSVLNTCTLSKGQGKVVPATKSVAIVQQAMYYSNQLKELNIELTSLNEQMIKISKQNHNKYKKNNHQTQQEEVIMLNNNKILIKERKEIDDMMNQFQSLNAAYEDGKLNVNANYMHYIVFMFVIIFLILLLLKVAVATPQYGGGNGTIDKSNILFGIFIVFIFVFYIIKYMQNN